MGRNKPKRRKYVKNYKKIFNVGKISMGVVSLVLFFLITTIFLVQSNRVAVKGYAISELEKKVAELQEQNDKMKIEASKLQSVSVIKEGIKDDKMVPVKQINYVFPSKDVALR